MYLLESNTNYAYENNFIRLNYCRIIKIAKI